jgi:hypothetical protein
MFGRKTRGSSWLAISQAQPEAAAAPPLFSARLRGSYERTAWKQQLHDQLVQAGVTTIRPGPARLEICATTGPDRNWTALRKPAIDAFWPVLGDLCAMSFGSADELWFGESAGRGPGNRLGRQIIMSDGSGTLWA